MNKIPAIIFIGLLIWSNNLLAQYSEPAVKDKKGTSNNGLILLEVYPNPVSEYLNITQQHFDGSVSQLEIIDLSGHTVYEVKERFTQLSIFVGNWRKGIYMVFFRQGDAEVMKKIVVQ